MLNNFSYYQPTEIKFGWGEIENIGKVVAQYGKKCLLVTMNSIEPLEPVFENIKSNLEKSGVEVFHFDGVVPNPTTNSVNKGSKMAIDNNVDVVLGVGGGSSMDTAKAIAVGSTHAGEAWDYRLFSDKKITDDILPIIEITTTSGTGSQVTPVSVVTNPKIKSKYALVDKLLFPEVSIVDPQLMVTVPEHITASTGFDVFAHSFESFIHKDSSVYTDMLAIEAIKRVVKYLPIVLENPNDKKARTEMAWADTLAGLCIANAGTTLPHGVGMAIGGHIPNIMHAEALAIIYPEFMRYTFEYAESKFARLARILNPNLNTVSDQIAAEKSCGEIEAFLEKIGMDINISDYDVSNEELLAIAEDTMKLPDYSVNPRVASKEEVLEMLKRS